MVREAEVILEIVDGVPEVLEVDDHGGRPLFDDDPDGARDDMDGNEHGKNEPRVAVNHPHAVDPPKVMMIHCERL